MSILLLHHRLAVVTALMALIAYAGGAGPEFVSGLVAGALLVISFFWRPTTRAMERLERIWLPLAILLVLRAAYHAFLLRDDVVLPVVDLLLLLLVAEAFRPAGSQNDARLYSLSFALVLAATAYRPGLLFLLGFAGFVIVGTVGLMVGHLKRQARRTEQPPPRINRAFLGGAVGVAGGILVLAVVVFFVFPRASQAFPGRIGAPPTTVAGFQDRVSIGDHGARIQANPAVVFRVEFPDGLPSRSDLYWRGRSYDRFDGQAWSRSRRMPASSGRSSWYERRWGQERVEQKIFASRLDVRVLFALHPLIRVEPDSPIQPIFDNAGDFSYWGSTAPVYSAFSVVSRPSPAELRDASGSYYPGRGVFLQLPQLSPRILRLADSLTARHESRYDKVVAVRDFLTSEFSYTLELPGSAGEATLVHFLFERRAGHCEYFSTAMAMLLRSVGIEAREVNGFLGGEWNQFGNYLAVTQNQAHTWVEVWFPGIGWVPFDPTPSASLDGSSLLSWSWPGRFFFDGLRHRWNKWVLDYDTGDQLQILGSVRSALASEEVVAPESDGGSAFIWPILLVVSTGIAAFFALRGRRSRRQRPAPVSAQFLKLRRACGQAGVPDAERLPASWLPDAVAGAGLPGSEAVRRFVDLYLGVRFAAAGAETGAPEDVVEELRSELRAARRALRGRSLVGDAEPRHL